MDIARAFYTEFNIYAIIIVGMVMISSLTSF